jgi:hypothetical protein
MLYFDISSDITIMTAALLQARFHAHKKQDLQEKAKITAMVLFYPAIDPADDTHHCTVFPFGIPYLRVKPHQSLLNWFFERAVLRDDSTKW